MTAYRVVTPHFATDYDDGIKATVAHCKNVALNVTSLLLRTYDDALPDETVQAAQVVDNYVATERPGSRVTWTLGNPEPAFREPHPPSTASEVWRSRAFYYALGQIESMFDLSPLGEGDAASFSYFFRDRGLEYGFADNADLRLAWERWSQDRRVSIERDGIVEVAVGGRPAPRPGVDYLADGEHDPNLGGARGDLDEQG